MSKSSPLLTLGSVAVLAVILLTVDIRIGNPAATAATTTAPAQVAAAPLHALFAGRTSGNELTVAIAVNGRKAAADLNIALPDQVALAGSASGDKVTLTGPGGVRLAGAVSGEGLFGTISESDGRVFVFSAQRTVVEAVYAGRSSGNQVTLAVDTVGHTAAAYVCDGKTIEAWLQGSVKGNQLTLAGNNGASLTGSLSGLDLFGTVSPRTGQSFPFAAELSPHPAGVYQARIKVNGLATRIGWAVLPDGTQAGVAVEGTTRVPAPALDLSDNGFTVDGASFTATPVAGNDTVVSP